MLSCLICEKVLEKGAKTENVKEKGLRTIREASKIRRDGLLEKLSETSKGLTVHELCRRNYTRSRDLDKLKSHYAALDSLTAVSFVEYWCYVQFFTYSIISHIL
jgi:hypothetical protein